MKLSRCSQDRGKANTQIIHWLYVDPHPLAANMIHGFGLAVGLSLPALMHAPRVLRAPPLMVLIGLFLFNNSYLEAQMVLEATGEPMPAINIPIHMFFCAIMGLIALMPDPEPEPKDSKPHSA